MLAFTLSLSVTHRCNWQWLNTGNISRPVTFDECESEKCVDLKTVFSITDDAESRIQKFNVSFMTQVEASIQDFNEIIFGEQKTIYISRE